MKDATAPECWSELSRMQQNSRVSQFLKSKGYRYIFISTGYFGKGMSKYAEIYTSSSVGVGTIEGMKLSRFANYLVRSTALAPFAATFWAPGYASGVRNKTLNAFNNLADMPNEKGPKFVWAHVTCPHPPFVFDRNGEPAEPIGGEYTLEDERERYLEQLLFVNKKVKALVDEILLKSDVAPIIILQSDTGPGSLGQGVVPDAKLTKIQLDKRVNILNAYYLPENGSRLLYESITPVNSFRIIFNLYFDTDYDLLEDRSYFLDMTPIPPENNSE